MNHEDKMDQITELLEELILDAFLSVIRKLYDRTLLEPSPSTLKEDLPF